MGPWGAVGPVGDVLKEGVAAVERDERILHGIVHEDPAVCKTRYGERQAELSGTFTSPAYLGQEVSVVVIDPDCTADLVQNQDLTCWTMTDIHYRPEYVNAVAHLDAYAVLYRELHPLGERLLSLLSYCNISTYLAFCGNSMRNAGNFAASS